MAIRSKRVHLRSFRKAVGQGLAIPAGTAVSKFATLAFEGDGERRKQFVISTARIDREGDSIAVGGWDLDPYRKNPVVFVNHDTHALPIARAVEVGVDGDALKAVVEFVPFDMPDGVGARSEAVFRMCSEGFLRTCSVGFQPLEFEVAKERMSDNDWFPPLNFIKQQLLELSIVGIPANIDAKIIDDEETWLNTLAGDQSNSPAGTPVLAAAAVEARKSAAAAEAARLAQESIERAATIAQRRRQLRAACY